MNEDTGFISMSFCFTTEIVIRQMGVCKAQGVCYRVGNHSIKTVQTSKPCKIIIQVTSTKQSMISCQIVCTRVLSKRASFLAPSLLNEDRFDLYDQRRIFPQTLGRIKCSLFLPQTFYSYFYHGTSQIFCQYFCVLF